MQVSCQLPSERKVSSFFQFLDIESWWISFLGENSRPELHLDIGQALDFNCHATLLSAHDKNRCLRVHEHRCQ